MKVCDKCRKEMPNEIMQTSLPSFYIRKIDTNMLTDIEINLCASCSKKFEEWLKFNDENNIGFDKPNEISSKLLKTSEQAEKNLKTAAEKLNKQLITQKKNQIKQLKTEIKKLKKSSNYKEFIKVPDTPTTYPINSNFICGKD